jgi:hypothetical protein
MRRLIAFMAVLGILLIPPLIVSASEMFYENMTTISATIPTAAAPDASFGAMGTGFGLNMLTAYNDNGVTMPADDFCDVPVTYFCLRAKGSGHGAGVHFISASALVENCVSLNLDATSGNCYDATANPAAIADGTRTFQRRTILRC